MKLIKVICFLLFLFCSLSVPFSCYYDNEEELYGNQPGVCDTTLVKYSTIVKPLLENQCTGCHSPTGSQSDYPLHTYDAVKVYVTNGLLINRINDAENPMPQSGLMPSCDIRKIEAWVNAGALND
jgi:hypothetical protein